MSRKGFTLIEVMVSMVILSVGLLAVLKMGYVYVQANSFNLQMGKASVLAQDKMEKLRSYATSDRVDRYSVFDFDYVVSELANFTTVYDPATDTDIAVHGLLSGSNGGSEVTTPWETVYEVLYDDGTHGDVTADDGVYTGSDVVDVMPSGATTGTIQVERRWTVEPFYFPNKATNPKADYAKLEVYVKWVDRSAKTHSTTLQSVINRRQ